MSFFSPSANRPAKTASEDALDTLASVIRTFGRVAFDMSDRGGAQNAAKAVAEDAERWARRLLIGVGRDEGSNTSQDLVAMRQWFEARRSAEKSFVEDHLAKFRSSVSNLLRGVRGILTEDKQFDVAIDGHLVALEKALAEGRLDAVPALIPRAVEGIRGVMAQRQSSLREQLAVMGEHIATLRQDLDSTRREAELDSLTRLHNRAAFDRTLEQSVQLATGTSTSFALVFVDIDHFKRLNDTHGHPAGDAVLVKTADTLVRCFPRRDDLVARYGGEEFCVIVRDVDASSRDRLVDRLLKAVREQRCAAPNDTLSVTCSVGTAMWRSGDTPQSLLERADAAMYRAKNSGRDRAVHG